MRILAGTHKGRALLAPPKGASARPITGAAKKSLFDTLSGLLPGAAVADLYCGTGTMGLEAVSRGADRVYFAEREAGTMARLRRNINELGVAGRCVIWAGDVWATLARRLERLDRPLDVVFVDPPYAHSRRWDWDEATRRLFEPLAAKLSADGVVALRVEGKAEPPDRLGPLDVIRRKRYGGMAVALLALPTSRPNRSEENTDYTDTA